MGFGTLRVINNDTVQAGTGFGMHPHDNMEIVTIALSWSLTHKDSMGNTKTLIPGEVQSMSAGTGVFHSEMNDGTDNWEFFQVWIETRKRNILPQYDQKTFLESERKNTFQLLAGPQKDKKNVLINQDAFISRCTLESQKTLTYSKKREENGIYIMNIFWEIIIENTTLKYRDALWIIEKNTIEITALIDSDFFVFEVPMK